MKRGICIIAIIMSILIIDEPVNASVKGYAIYRDGASFGNGWHAGLVVKSDVIEDNCIVHSPGGSEKVRVCDFTGFLAGNDSIGFYLPKQGIDSTGRTKVAEMAKKLATENITCTLTAQLEYASGTGSKIQPENITKMRCDGVVEYCYEYYGYRIYGEDGHWDVSLKANNTYHDNQDVTPSSQASCMQRVYFSSK